VDSHFENSENQNENHENKNRWVIIKMRTMRIRINEIAKALNTSKATTYRLIKKHKKILSENNENHLRKDENGQYLTLKGLNILASIENKILDSIYSENQNVRQSANQRGFEIRCHS